MNDQPRICSFCGKECKNKNSHINHERCCPNNLNRIYKNGMLGKKGTNQYANGAIMTTETKIRLSKAITGSACKEETKKKLSKIRSEWMRNNPDKLRRKISYMERSFGEWLDQRNISYKTEVYFRDKQNNKSYFVDFLFQDKNLIIELDGNQHEKRIEQDLVRDRFLNSLGYIVLRITHKDYLNKSKVPLVEDLLGM